MKATASQTLPSYSSSNKRVTSKPNLAKKLGTADIVFTVLAYNAPLTVVTGFLPLIVAEGNGLGAPLAFLFSACLIMLFVTGFTAMSEHTPNPGAFYSYITSGLGRQLGLGSAFVAIMGYFCFMISIYCYAGIAFGGLAKNLIGNPLLPWWGWSFLVMSLISVMGYLKITLSAAVLSIALILEIITVLFWQGAVVSEKGISGISMDWLSSSAFLSGSVGIAILLAVCSFAGFEATAIFREEARDPEKTIPRAAFMAVGVLAVLFFTSAVIYVTAYGSNSVIAVTQADPSNGTINSIGQYLGAPGLLTVNVLLCSSIFACLLALQNITARYIYSLASDKVLPKTLSKVHPKHQSPYLASLVVSIASCIVFGICVVIQVDPYVVYGGIGGVAGYALMLLETLTAFAIIAYFAKNKHSYSFMRVYVAPGLAAVGLIVTSWLATTNLELLTGNTKLAYSMIALAFVLLITGVMYALYLRKNKPESYNRIGRQDV
ncbi:APC family permease [Pseudomonas sp. H11T01]|uniref:APC family permease n=1 Tax=Pseudomonas sp. H11T01 TaxID=3402749 RepID=UPI003AD5B5EE